MATKKSSQTQKAKPGRQRIKTSAAEEAQTISGLRQQLAESLQRERNVAEALQERDVQLAESVEQQTATSESSALSAPRLQICSGALTL